MKQEPRRVRLGCGLLLMLTWATGPVQAAGPDYVREDKPVADAQEDAEGLMIEGFGKPRPLPSLFPRTKARLADLPAFFRDASVQIKPRSYYFDRQRDSGDSAAWALGGALDVDSGWWRERLRASAVLYTSQRLYGPRDKGGTLLLKPVQNSFTVLGQAYLELRLSAGISARVGRTDTNLPYLNRQDNRMVPSTFEAVGLGGNVHPQWQVQAAYVTRMKKRDSDDFVPISEAAGLADSDEHLALGGLRWSPLENFNVGAVNLYAREFMNTFYAEANYATDLGRDLDIGLSAQYTDQRSVGRELDGNFETGVFGGRIEATWHAVTASLAFSSTRDDSPIRSPFGSYPGYLSLMISDFNRAGEDAWLAGLAVDFAGLGLTGLSGFINYARGRAPETDSGGSERDAEIDITLDWRPRGRGWSGLWLRLRHARLDRGADDLGDVRDWRVILNHTLPVL